MTASKYHDDSSTKRYGSIEGYHGSSPRRFTTATGFTAWSSMPKRAILVKTVEDVYPYVNPHINQLASHNGQIMRNRVIYDIEQGVITYIGDYIIKYNKEASVYELYNMAGKVDRKVFAKHDRKKLKAENINAVYEHLLAINRLHNNGNKPTAKRRK